MFICFKYELYVIIIAKRSDGYNPKGVVPSPFAWQEAKEYCLDWHACQGIIAYYVTGMLPRNRSAEVERD